MTDEEAFTHMMTPRQEGGHGLLEGLPEGMADWHSGAHERQNCHHYHTKTGKILTDADIEALAAKAEQDYDVSQLKDRPSRRDLDSS